MHPLLRTLSHALDPDRALQTTMTGLIEATAMRRALAFDGERWTPGNPLKLLLAGYVGTRNTGADVRVAEMIRQFRHILGRENAAITVMSVDPSLSAGYFPGVRQVTLPSVFPHFLYTECPKHHGVISCEGSMFKSKFADALSTMMAGSLGMASAEGKIAIGYGAEAGAMSSSLRAFVARHARDALVICRNEPSREVLEGLGIRHASGADTAWTFDPAPPARGEELLRSAGWDGHKRILAICPVNPFWWPVKPDLVKAAALHLTGQHRDAHYKSVYFHHQSTESREKNAAYLDAIAGAVNDFQKDHDVFPILVGMEALDRPACAGLQERLVGGAPLFISDEHDMFDLVSVIRHARMMVSSRYHAMVTSMPAGVPSAGVTIDERITNLLAERHHPDLGLTVEDPELRERLLGVLHTLHDDEERIRTETLAAVPAQLARMADMGREFVHEVRRFHPDLPIAAEGTDDEAWLPPLPASLLTTLEEAA